MQLPFPTARVLFRSHVDILFGLWYSEEAYLMDATPAHVNYTLGRYPYMFHCGCTQICKTPPAHG